MLNTKNPSTRVPYVISGLFLSIISLICFCIYLHFRAYFLFSDVLSNLGFIILLLGLFFSLLSLKFFTGFNSNIQNKIFKDATSDIDKINAFIYYTNSEICGRKVRKGELAMPLMFLGNRYCHSKWFIQPLLTIDNIDIFLTNNCVNLVSYRINISLSEYLELKKLLTSNVDEFNKEIVLRGYIIKPEEF